MIQGIQRFWTGASGSMPPRISHAKGIHIWDTSGRRYIDMTSGPIAVNVGHGNERILAAMRQQAEKVCFAYPSNFECEASTTLSTRLAQLAGAGLDCAYYVSSGSEAVEKCLQFARRAAIALGQPERFKVLSRNPSYHGSTVATMALAADAGYAPYLSSIASTPQVPAPSSYRPRERMSAQTYALHCAEQLRTQIQQADPKKVLAFIMEPVMGFCGGADYAPPEYYTRVRQICDEFGVLLVFDEIVSGAGRTGHFLAADAWPTARPDMVVLAKGLAGGYLPLSAFLAPARLVDAVAGSGGFHVGHTHKAHPLASAVGLAVLEEIESGRLIAKAHDSGVYLRQKLRHVLGQLDIVGDVRGAGLLNAVEIVADRGTKQMLPRALDVIGRVKAIALEHGLLIYGRRTHAGQFGDWVMVTPPLVIEHSEIDELADGLAATLTIFRAELAAGSVLR